jgi:hypothetical protein
MRRLTLLATAFCATLVLACGDAPDDTGWLEFTLDGESYRLEDVTLLIRANPTFYDGLHVKSIARGQDHVFGFSLERPPTTDDPARHVDVQWFVAAAEPGGLTGRTLRSQAAGGDARGIALLINYPGISLRHEPREDHETWVALDALEGGRARGRFGGPLNVIRFQPNGGEPGAASALVDDGTFDVPYLELFEFR